MVWKKCRFGTPCCDVQSWQSLPIWTGSDIKTLDVHNQDRRFRQSKRVVHTSNCSRREDNRSWEHVRVLQRRQQHPTTGAIHMQVLEGMTILHVGSTWVRGQRFLWSNLNMVLWGGTYRWTCECVMSGSLPRAGVRGLAPAYHHRLFGIGVYR